MKHIESETFRLFNQ